MVEKIWFSHSPANSLTKKYLQSDSCANLGFMVRRPFRTILINLTATLDEISAQFTPNCRNEIRKAEKIGLQARFAIPTVDDQAHVSAFMLANALGLPAASYFDKDTGFATSVSFNGTWFFTHIYHLQHDIGRARLVFSVKNIKIDEQGTAGEEHRRIRNIANRYLHYADICWFKENGFSLYDFGGVGAADGDAKIQGINSFKRSFGGADVEEFNYTPVLINAAEYLLGKYRHFKRR